MDFFYDEGKGKPYKSIADWHHEIKHLVWPSAVLFILLVLAIAFVANLTSIQSFSK